MLMLILFVFFILLILDHIVEKIDIFTYLFNMLIRKLLLSIRKLLHAHISIVQLKMAQLLSAFICILLWKRRLATILTKHFGLIHKPCETFLYDSAAVPALSLRFNIRWLNLLSYICYIERLFHSLKVIHPLRSALLILIARLLILHSEWLWLWRVNVVNVWQIWKLSQRWLQLTGFFITFSKLL